MSDQMKARVKSFAWRIAMMVLAAALDFAAQNIANFNIPPQYVVVLGLALGEVSKWLNNKWKEKQLAATL